RQRCSERSTLTALTWTNPSNQFPVSLRCTFWQPLPKMRPAGSYAVAKRDWGRGAALRERLQRLKKVGRVISRVGVCRP
ncbi:MAG: hypothetical protein QOJ15_9757, partial [Bradyrhizobium sp.]|nr:hypothetical protein [Bradyrhizobium sp.]